MAKEINGLLKFRSPVLVRKTPVYVCAPTLDEAKAVIVVSMIELGIALDNKMLNLEQVEFSERASSNGKE